jgi:hypothetical protein
MAKKFRVVTSAPDPDAGAMPPELGPHGRSLWTRVMAEYDVADCGGREMLAQACAALDRAEKCRVHIDRDGEIVAVRGIPREHPLLKAELASRAFIIRTLARLGLNFEPVRSGPGRPPGYA